MIKSRTHSRRVRSSPSMTDASRIGANELWRPTPVALAVSLALSMWPAVPAWAQKAPLPVICAGAVACGGKGGAGAIGDRFAGTDCRARQPLC